MTGEPGIAARGRLGRAYGGTRTQRRKEVSGPPGLAKLWGIEPPRAPASRLVPRPWQLGAGPLVGRRPLDRARAARPPGWPSILRTANPLG